MLSRTANAIYWMSRYLERAENVARIVAVNVHLMLDLGLNPGKAQWEPLVTTSGDEADFDARYGEYNEKNVLQFLTFDRENPNSILSCICAARENARTVRDVISSQLWEQINALYHMVLAHNRKRRLENLEGFYVDIRSRSHLFTGLMENTMAHDEGWHFARLGRMLERADKTARILDVKYFLLLPSTEYVDSSYDSVEWGAVLKSANAFEMYRKHYHTINYLNVAEFLIFNKTFPRSMHYCAATAYRSLKAITRELEIDMPAQAEIARLQTTLATTLETIFVEGLHEFLDRFQGELNLIDQAIHRAFFADPAL